MGNSATYIEANREKTRAYMREYYLRTTTRKRMIPGAERASKVCKRCGIDKPRSEYTVRESGPRIGHLAAHCKPCSSASQGDRYREKHRDPGHYRSVEWPSKLKRLYGITVDDYNRMLAAQGGGCGLCGTKDPHVGNRKYPKRIRSVFDVDHCHATGKVRGLLCTRCNRLVGLAGDNPLTALRLATYLGASQEN